MATRFSRLCASLRLPEDSKDGLFNLAPIEEASNLMAKGYAHVLYAVDHKAPRGKTHTAIVLPSEKLEVFNSDSDFEERTNWLYAHGCYWIGALHEKANAKNLKK